MQNGITVKQNFRCWKNLSCKKFFSNGVIIPTRMGNCENCEKSVEKICDICKSKTKQTKEFKAKIIDLKRKPTNKYGHMLAFYVTN